MWDSFCRVEPTSEIACSKITILFTILANTAKFSSKVIVQIYTPTDSV